MKVLDLFCCDGGASMGIHQAGVNDIVGVDINPHPNYPFHFIQADVFKLIDPSDLQSFDFIWASPPCQLFTLATNSNADKSERYVNLIPQTRELLLKSGKPFVIENVPRAPIRKDLMLCGSMFGIPTYRHRHFEIHGFKCEQPTHEKHSLKSTEGEVFTVVGKSPLVPGYYGDKEKRSLARVALKKKLTEVGGTLKLYQEVMGITHTDVIENISEAVPPCYSKYIMEQFMYGLNKCSTS